MTRRVLETVTRVAEPHTDCRTAEQMTDICCESTGALPCCEKVEPWAGYSDQEFIDKLGLVLDEQGRDEQGRYVVIRRLPRSQPCGEQVTRYDVSPNVCCDGVEPLAWDAENSAGVIANNSYGIVSVTGGRFPLYVSVRGSGFYLDQQRTLKDGVAYGRTIAIYTANACGTCTVTISDGCSTVEEVILSTEGEWVSIPLSQLPGSFRNVVSEPFDPFAGVTKQITGIQGQYRVKQYWSWSLTSSSAATSTDPCFPGAIGCDECCGNEALMQFAMCMRPTSFPDIDPEEITTYVIPIGYPEAFKYGHRCVHLQGIWNNPYESVYWRKLTVTAIPPTAEKWVC